MDAEELATDYRAQVREASNSAERRAVSNYTGGFFQSMNDLLRNGPSWLNEGSEQEVADMNRLMSRYRLPGSVTANRGLSDDSSLPPAGQAIGKVITSAGFQSTQIGDAPAPDFERSKVRMSITVPAGMNAIIANGITSTRPGEEEMILPHGTRYAVTDDETRGGTRWLTVTALPPI